MLILLMALFTNYLTRYIPFSICHTHNKLHYALHWCVYFYFHSCWNLVLRDRYCTSSFFLVFLNQGQTLILNSWGHILLCKLIYNTFSFLFVCALVDCVLAGWLLGLATAPGLCLTSVSSKWFFRRQKVYE